MATLAASIPPSAFYKTDTFENMHIPNAHTSCGELMLRSHGQSYAVQGERFHDHSQNMDAGSLPIVTRCKSQSERLRAFDDLVSKHLAAPSAQPRRVFANDKAKELDSGITELETPDEPDIEFPSSRPSSAAGSIVSTRSTASAPPTLGSDSVGSPTTASSPSSQTAISLDLSTAHNAALLRCREDAFQWSQRCYPGDAILFVGNLPAHFTDLQLSDQLLDIFFGFGDVYIHIDRQYTREFVKPYALLQFTMPLHAENALIHVTRRIPPRIGGRPLRVERSNAKREMIVCRRDDMIPSDLDIIRTFGDYGVIEMVHRREVSRFQDLPKISIKYRCYGSFLDAKKAVEQREGLAAAYRIFAF